MSNDTQVRFSIAFGRNKISLGKRCCAVISIVFMLDMICCTASMTFAHGAGWLPVWTKRYWSSYCPTGSHNLLSL